MAIAVSLEDELMVALSTIDSLDLSPQAEIHLVHVVPTILYARGMHPSVLTYPLPEDRPKIEEGIMAKLKAIQEKLFPGKDKIVLKCLFGSNEKEVFCDYLKEQKMDLAVVATRGKHGFPALFDSSFAQHLCRFSPVPVVVLR